MTKDWAEQKARDTAMSLPPSDFGSARAINAFAQALRDERAAVDEIVEALRGVTRIVMAYKYTGGIGRSQTERLEAATALLANIDKARAIDYAKQKGEGA